MGLYDTVELYEDVRLPEYPPSAEPADEISWQTKGIDRPAMGRFRITADGRLLEAEFHTETVPPEERPYAGRDDVDEDDFRYFCGLFSQVHDGWIHRDDYHGRFRIIHAFETVDPLVTYQVTFTHGRLDGFERIR